MSIMALPRSQISKDRLGIPQETAMPELDDIVLEYACQRTLNIHWYDAAATVRDRQRLKQTHAVTAHGEGLKGHMLMAP